MNIFLNKYFGFCFELNHFQAKFNEKMNFQNVSNRANTTGRAQIKSLVQYLYQYQHLYDPIFVICSFHLSASQRLSQSVNRSDIHFWLYFHKIWKKVLILGKLEFVIRLIKATLLQYQIDGKGAICSFALISGQNLSTISALFLGYLNLQQNSVDFTTKQCRSEQSHMFNFTFKQNH